MTANVIVSRICRIWSVSSIDEYSAGHASIAAGTYFGKYSFASTSSTSGASTTHWRNR